MLSKSEPSAPPWDPHLCALTLVDEEDTGKGVREAGAVGSKEAASLVHVGAELEGLLLCGKSRMRLGEQATSQRALSRSGFRAGATQTWESSLTSVDQADGREGE